MIFPEGPDNKLLDQYLTLVLDTCKDRQLLELLKKYCDALGKEAARYTPFTQFANYALAKLATNLGSTPGLKPISDLNILFHVHDKKALRSSNGKKDEGSNEKKDKDLQRLPDLVLSSLAAIQRAHNKPNCTYEEALGLCVKSGHSGFLEEEILAPTEVKWHYDPIRASPPETYEESAKSVQPTNVPEMSTSPLETDVTSSDPGFGDGSGISLAVPGVSSQLVSPRVSKRPRDSTSSQPSKNRTPKKAKDEKEHRDLKGAKTDLMVQTGLNALQALRCTLGRRHSINLTIVDENLTIWWIDRQGPIRSTDLNFVEKLPHFLVFLLNLQRFDLADWGYNTTLDPVIIDIHTSAAKIPDRQPTKLKVHSHLIVSIDPNSPIHKTCSLASRATVILKATTTSSCAAGSNLVAKLSWPNVGRGDESCIVEQARAFHEGLHDHLPLAFGSCDMDSTKAIREALGIEGTSPRPTRVLRIIIFEELHPLLDLRGDLLLTAWVHCVRCHFIVWKHGIQHRDISLNNLMYRKKGNEVLGVVNDWDLSHTDGNPELPKDLTATIPFLSLEVLMHLGAGNRIDRCYYHDLESLLWTLLWSFLFVEDGKLDREDVDYKELATGDAKVCHSKKLALLDYLKATLKKPKAEWNRLWPVGQMLITWRHEHEDPEKRGDERSLFVSFLNSVERSKPGDYVVPLVPSNLHLG